MVNMARLLCFLSLSIGCSFAKGVNLSLHHADLPETIRVLSKQLHQEVVISPSVRGEVTINLQDNNVSQALGALLLSQGLGQMTIGKVHWVATFDEIVKYQEGRIKSRHIGMQASPMKPRLWKIQYAKASALMNVISVRMAKADGSVNVKVDDRTNSIYLYETEETLKEIDSVIRLLDVPIPHVLIKARLVSMDRNMENDLGLQLSTTKVDQAGSLASKWVENGGYTLSVAKLIDHTALDVKLSLLERAGRAELVASPSLYAASRESAYIESGEEVPYQESSENGGTTVVFKKAVLGLQVTPQVLPGRRILLQLKINQDRPSHQMVLGVPTISTRQLQTSVLLKTGETVVVGGIHERNAELGETQIPWLSRLPVIGWLFRRESRQQVRRDLLIFVTPIIIS